jgi:ATP-dependent DNA ligase
MAFDQLYDRYRPVMDRPLAERRELLKRTLERCAGPRLVSSEGVIGPGKSYFDEACARGLEGIVAKRLDAPYLPGRRSDAWVKIKRHETLACAVIGFVPDEQRPSSDFSALIIATPDEDGQLRCVGRVGSGFDGRMRDRVNAYLWQHLQPEPVVPCREKGLWVEPGLYCAVRCMERTPDGQLRAPVFEGMLQ